MAIKKLQNNYTTQDQSKRLLELGVPADSADLLYTRSGIKIIPEGAIYSKFQWVVSDGDKTYPCWSVGRLIEIACKCWNGDRRAILFPNIGFHNNNIMEYVFHSTENDIQLGCLDFSKLEG